MPKSKSAQKTSAAGIAAGNNIGQTAKLPSDYRLSDFTKVRQHHQVHNFIQVQRFVSNFREATKL